MLGTTSACSLASSDGDPAAPSGAVSPPKPGTLAATETVAGPDADAALVTDVLRQLSVAHRVVQQTRRAHPSLTARLRLLEQLHAAHADALGGLVSVIGRTADASEDAAVALARVASAENRLQRRLVRGAVAAESGSLAQLLASIAAAVAQQRTLL